MELKQKKGKLFDLLSIEGDRILHKWHLTKESGESFAPISNIDPEFGKVVQKTEGRLPYLLLSLLPLFFLLFLPSLEAPEGSQSFLIAKVLGISMVAILFIALVWIGLSIKAKETVTVLRFRSGETFAIIRESWIDDKACDHFLNALKQRIANLD